MVLLNEEFLVDKVSIINNIKGIMEEVMVNYFYDEIIIKDIYKKKVLFNNIIKDKLEYVKSNNFWYLNTSRTICTHIFKKGKSEGYMCHKKIRTNLEGQKEDYLCSTHSKKHVPKKRLKKSVKNITKSIENSFSNIHKKDYCNKLYKDKNKIIKKKEKKRYKKIFICNSGKLNFSNIFNLL